MNYERIKELAKHAGFDIEEGGHIMLHHVYLTNRMENFAELIVKECLEMCTTAVGNRDYNTGRMHCYDNIKEHFGLEE